MAVETATRAQQPVRVLQRMSTWLELTQNWLFEQLVNLPPDVEYVVVADHRKNEVKFPVGELHVAYEGHAVAVAARKFAAKSRATRFTHLHACARRDAVDVIHSHFGPAGWETIGTAERLGIPHVVTFYGCDVSQLPFEHEQWRTRYKRLFQSVDMVLCEGPHMAAEVERLDCDPQKIRLHRIGVPMSDIPYRPRHAHDGTLRALVVGRFREKKGIPDAIRALGTFGRSHPVAITVVGDDDGSPESLSERATIEDCAARSGVPVDFVGSVDLLELRSLYYRHDVLVSPSVTASNGDTEGGAPITIIEAAASGMPVVSTQHCDIPDVLAEGRHLLAAERDVEGLVSRLGRVVEDASNSHLERVRLDLEARYDSRAQGALLGARYREVASRC